MWLEPANEYSLCPLGRVKLSDMFTPKDKVKLREAITLLITLRIQLQQANSCGGDYQAQTNSCDGAKSS